MPAQEDAPTTVVVSKFTKLVDLSAQAVSALPSHIDQPVAENVRLWFRLREADEWSLVPLDDASAAVHSLQIEDTNITRCVPY